MCTVCGCGTGPHDHHDHDHDHHHHDHGDSRLIAIEQNILAHNDRLAEGNRAYLAERGIFALNLVSSPGSGKTTLLCRTIEAINNRYPVSVIEGDQQTRHDADRRHHLRWNQHLAP